MYFTLSGRYSHWGSWGIYEDITKQSVKSEAIAQIVSAPTPTLTAGIALPALGIPGQNEPPN